MRAIYDYSSEAAALLRVGRLVREQLPQHILQNPAVRVIQGFLRRINAHQSLKFFGFFARFSANFDSLPRGKLLNDSSNPSDLENLISGQTQRLRTLVCEKLQRQNAH